MMFAVAGAFAEVVWGDRFIDDGICAEDCFAAPYFMSDSDWTMTGICERDAWPFAKLAHSAYSTVELLKGELWQPLLTTARTLMTRGVVQ